MEFAEIRSRIRPLDLVFFRGSDAFANLIGIFEDWILGDGDFTHVGIIVTRDILPQVEELVDGEFYIWESTFPSLRDIRRHILDVRGDRIRFGSQIRHLEDLIDSYTEGGKSKIAIGGLINNPWDDPARRVEIVEEMRVIYDEYGEKIYEFCCCNLMASIFPCCRTARSVFNTIVQLGQTILTTMSPREVDRHIEERRIERGEDLTSLRVQKSRIDQTFVFCSELVAAIYRDLRIISREIRPENIAPVDFLGSVLREDGERIIEDPIYLKIDR
jgi:hypothetical protein